MDRRIYPSSTDGVLFVCSALVLVAGIVVVIVGNPAVGGLIALLGGLGAFSVNYRYAARERQARERQARDER